MFYVGYRQLIFRCRHNCKWSKMSIVKIKFHSENIFKADSQDDKMIVPPKAKMWVTLKCSWMLLTSSIAFRYRSKFEKSIEEKRLEMKSARHLQHKTFGFAEIPLPTPDKYLRKDEGIRRLYDRPKTAHPRCTVRRPPIPHLDELRKAQSMQNLHNEKNFKRINIERAKSAFLRGKPGPKCFEQTAPVYIKQPKYGNVPRYLTKINEQLRTLEIESKRRQEELKSQNNDIRIVSQKEKDELLAGLQVNWDLMQKEYQKMPLLIDTVPKMIRKTKLENNLKSLEKDICMLNSNANCIIIRN